MFRRLTRYAVLSSLSLSLLASPALAQMGFSPSSMISSRAADVASSAIATSLRMVQGAEMSVDHAITETVTGFAVSPNGDLLALARSSGSVAVVDLIQGHIVSKLAAGEDGKGSAAAVVAQARQGQSSQTVNGQKLVLDGGVLTVTPAGGDLAARVVLASDGWAAVSQTGQFEAEGNGLDAVSWTADDQKFSLEQFSDSHYEPGLLARLLSAQAQQTASAPVETLAPPPAPKVEVSKSFAMPPTAAIQTVKDGDSSDAEDFQVPYQITDVGGGITEIRLYQNGKMVWNDKPAAVSEGESVSGSIETKLAQGNNEFRLVALSRDRIESRPAKVKVSYTGAERKSVLHVVAVGISSYKNPSLNLNYGVADAKGLVSYFEKQPKTLYRDVVIHTLYDTQASKDGILAVLDELKNTNPEDAVVIYLAGHGDTLGETWYFMPYDVRYPEREDEVRSRGLSSNDINDRIKNIGAQKVLMLVDACKSGAAMVAMRGFEDRKSLMRVARAAGVHVVAAAGKEQFAAEITQLGHGLFTYTLLEGLSGKADRKSSKVVTVRNLTNYIEDELPELSENYKGVAQFPVVDSRGMDFPVAVYE